MPGLVERARRFSAVVALAARIYAGYKSTQLWTRCVSDAKKAELYRRQDLRSATPRFNHTAISLEGLLIKTAQFIATRADLLPDEMGSTLAGLHDRVPPRPFAMIKHRVETELKRPLDEVFAEFEEIPIASASLAPGASRAAARWAGLCAVKVQYPGIDGIVRADLSNLGFVLQGACLSRAQLRFRIIAREALKYVQWSWTSCTRPTIAKRFGTTLPPIRRSSCPRSIASSRPRRVLTMEFIEGIKTRARR